MQQQHFFAKCNHTIHFLNRVGEFNRLADLLAGPAHDVKRYDEKLYDIHISGLGLDSFKSNTCLPAFLQALKKFHWFHEAAQEKLLALDIPDYGQPSLTSQFWEELFDRLTGQTVLVTCLGSHGRTGIIASILVGIDLNLKGSEAIAWVRGRHCTSCVETISQENYIRTILNAINGFQEAMVPPPISAPSIRPPLNLGWGEMEPQNETVNKTNQPHQQTDSF